MRIREGASQPTDNSVWDSACENCTGGEIQQKKVKDPITKVQYKHQCVCLPGQRFMCCAEQCKDASGVCCTAAVYSGEEDVLAMMCIDRRHG